MKKLIKTTALFLSFVFTNTCLLRAQEALRIDPAGNVGIGTTNPRGLLDVGGFINGKKIGTILGRLEEGNNEGDGTYLGVRGYGTQQTVYSGQSFAIEHSFYGLVNNSINFYRGFNKQGGYLTINTSDNTQRLKISEVGMEVSGIVKATEIKDATGYVTPKGGIIMYGGSIGNFDNGVGKPGTHVEGWAICNGKNGTPDLTDRFIVGAGGKYLVNDKGGQDSVQLSMNEMPLHNHVRQSWRW